MTESDPPQNQLENEFRFDLLPTLYNLLLDVDNGVVKLKDFDNNAGSLRLKLQMARTHLQSIKGIGETVEARTEKIEEVREANERKLDLLRRFNDKIDDLINEDQIMIEEND